MIRLPPFSTRPDHLFPYSTLFRSGSLEESYAYLQIPILIQAAQAWLAAGKVERAYTVQSAALAREPNNIELLVDRALTAASVGDYADAVADLGRALSHSPNRADRSEERRDGSECVSPCKSRWSPSH